MATKDWEIRAVEIGQASIATDFIGYFFCRNEIVYYCVKCCQVFLQILNPSCLSMRSFFHVFHIGLSNLRWKRYLLGLTPLVHKSPWQGFPPVERQIRSTSSNKRPTSVLPSSGSLSIQELSTDRSKRLKPRLHQNRCDHPSRQHVLSQHNTPHLEAPNQGIEQVPLSASRYGSQHVCCFPTGTVSTFQD